MTDVWVLVRKSTLDNPVKLKVFVSSEEIADAWVKEQDSYRPKRLAEIRYHSCWTVTDHVP